MVMLGPVYSGMQVALKDQRILLLLERESTSSVTDKMISLYIPNTKKEASKPPFFIQCYFIFNLVLEWGKEVSISFLYF